VEFQRLLNGRWNGQPLVNGLSTDISVSEVCELFASIDADQDGLISKNEWVEFFRQAWRDEQLDLDMLANAHQRTRHALVEELARLHLELSDCEYARAQGSTTHDTQTKAAIDAVWRIIEQCQIKDQVYYSLSPSLPPSLSLSLSLSHTHMI
jgi:hypothetical protein